MQVVNFTEARNNLKSIFDTVHNDREDVIVNRKNGENVVIISLESYNALKETDYLLSTPANRKHLIDSLSQLRNGKGKQRDMVE